MVKSVPINFQLSASHQEINNFVDALYDLTRGYSHSPQKQFDQNLETLKKMMLTQDAENIWPLLLQVVLMVQKSHLEQQNINENIFNELISEVIGIESAMLQSVHTASQALNHNGRQHDRQLTAYMGGLAQDINNANSLELLKTHAVAHLGNMRESIKSRQQREQEIFENNNKEIDRLSKELATAQQTMKNLETERQLIQQAALTCPLTGIANKRAFDRHLNFAITDESSWPLCLAVLDVDNFKTFNDSYGHQAGDKVLITITQQISQVLSQDDRLFRYAGDEFVLMFQKQDLAQAAKMAENIRASIESVRFRYKQEVLQVTVTIGLTQATNDDDGASLFERADLALLEAKHTRNQVIVKQFDRS
ncbi:MAG: GGDEF domain-containing protein [Desulfarculales bacterium]|jgi:diguanylate cyclase (GGDEF)-like protein|nr:GGDEF domain-containing protein [Desulfarculales bacterium]